MSQGTQCKLVEGEGQVEVGATRLLGLEGLAVSRVDLAQGSTDRVVHLVTDAEAAAACPACGVVSTSCKGGVVTHPRDLPHGEEELRLMWHKRRWRCREAACERATFTESLPAVPARARVTTRVRTGCGKGIGAVFSCVAAGAAFYGMSWPVAHASFIAQVDPVLGQPLPPVQVLGLDWGYLPLAGAARRGKLKWAQDPLTHRWAVVAGRWHTGIVDATGTGGLLGQVEGRTAALVTSWLQAQSEAWRDGISHVTIDLSASYARAVADALPDAVLVADRFHLIALANAMVTDVRQRVTREALGRRGRRADPQWANRRRLLTGREHLSDHSFTRMWNQLTDAGDPGVQILLAYTVKENLLQLLDLAGTNPDREVISHRLYTFYDQAAASRAPEVHRLATTIETWWPAIEAGLDTGYSNARSEGYNRLAKHQGRNAFGFRNVTNHRRRIRWSCTRQHRRATALLTGVPG